jgi:hypothetical protein
MDEIELVKKKRQEQLNEYYDCATEAWDEALHIVNEVLKVEKGDRNEKLVQIIFEDLLRRCG